MAWRAYHCFVKLFTNESFLICKKRQYSLEQIQRQSKSRGGESDICQDLMLEKIPLGYYLWPMLEKDHAVPNLKVMSSEG